MRCCDAAIEVLRETNNPAVMAGDLGLLHMIADRLDWKHEGPRTTDRVIAALHKTPGELLRKYTLGSRNQRTSLFILPERASEYFKEGNSQNV